MYAKNFHKVHGSTIIGINTTSVVEVPAMSGALKSLTASNEAVLGENHSFILSYAASITTIEVSIAIHKVKINEKFVRKFSEYHN
jgi:hypothetical protein